MSQDFYSHQNHFRRKFLSAVLSAKNFAFSSLNFDIDKWIWLCCQGYKAAVPQLHSSHSPFHHTTLNLKTALYLHVQVHVSLGKCRLLYWVFCTSTPGQTYLLFLSKSPWVRADVCFRFEESNSHLTTLISCLDRPQNLESNEKVISIWFLLTISMQY